VRDVKITIIDSEGTAVASVQTDESGHWSAPNIRPGDYTVEVELPKGFRASTPSKSKVRVANGLAKPVQAPEVGVTAESTALALTGGDFDAETGTAAALIGLGAALTGMARVRRLRRRRLGRNNTRNNNQE
jgi:uncharacterized surface anchored protein